MFIWLLKQLRFVLSKIATIETTGCECVIQLDKKYGPLILIWNFGLTFDESQLFVADLLKGLFGIW